MDAFSFLPPYAPNSSGRALRNGCEPGLRSHPPWLEVRTPNRSPDAQLAHLDAGERDAILLAEELGADQIIIDEIRGRREAERRQLPFTRTLGVLAAAAESGLLNLRSAVDRLRHTNFHIAQNILDRLIEGQP